MARRMKAGGGGTPGAGTLCPSSLGFRVPTLRRVLCFGALLLQQGTCQPPAVGLPPTARLATAEVVDVGLRAGGVIWGALKQWPELLTPPGGRGAGWT